METDRQPGLLLALLILTSLGPPAIVGAACQTRTVVCGGIEVLEMENELILARVVPSRYGALSDLIWKPSNAPTLLPLLDQHVEVIPGTGVYAKGDSRPGLRDWLWPGLPHPAGHAFVGRIAQAGGDTAAIAVEMRAGDWDIQRTTTIHAGRSCVDVEVAITHHGSRPARKAYWSNTMLQMGGDFLSMPGDDNDVLFVPARREDATVQGTVPRPLPYDQVVVHVPSLHETSAFYAPAQPWLAAVDRAKQLLLGCVVDEPDFPRDALFYSWTGSQMTVMTCSLEVIHPLRDFAPGQTRSCRFRFVLLSGLDTVDYLTSDLAIALRAPAAGVLQADDALTVAGKVGSPGTRERVTVAFWLQGEQGRSAEAPVRLGPLGPNRPLTFATRLPLRGLKPGPYVLRGRIEGGSGAFAFLNQRITVVP
jgi:hypothetical protein